MDAPTDKPDIHLSGFNTIPTHLAFYILYWPFLNKYLNCIVLDSFKF